jgi:O-antigen/teichoic acid export membrane protein
MVLGRIVNDVGGLLTTIVLARLITPAELGHAAIALIVPMLALILAYEGFGSALVQRRSVTPEHFATALSLSVASGLAMTLGLVAFALTVGDDVFDPTTAELLVIISPTFLIGGVSANSRAYLTRDVRLATIANLELLSFVVTTVLSVGLVVAGFGTYGLVIGALFGFTAEAVVATILARPRRPRFDPDRAREIFSYGGFAMMNGLGFVMRRQSPFLVMGAVADPRSTGLLLRAYQAGAENQGRITNVLGRMAFPVMSRASTTDDLALLRHRMTSVNALIVLPLIAAFVLTAPDLVRVVYGEQWIEAVLPAQILALAGVALALNVGTDGLMLATGRSRELMIFTWAGVAGVVGAVVVVHDEGLVAVSTALAAVYLAQLIVAQTVLLRIAGIKDTRFFATVAAPIIASGVAYVAGAGALEAVGEAGAGLRILVPSLVVAAAYLGALRVAFPESWRQLSTVIQRIVNRGGRAKSVET